MPVSSVLIIVLNWRQPAVTLECVESLRRLDYDDISLLVIDNGSGDGSSATLLDCLDASQFLALPRNLGFAGGCNVGLQAAMDRGFQYALLINNDAFPSPDMLTRLMAAVEDDIGLLSPKILYEEDPQRIWFASGRQHPLTLNLVDSGRGETDGPDWRFSRDADYLLGTCLLVNLPAAQVVGPLDERYFMYYEDLDWSIRFRAAGYRLRMVADAHLYHRVAVSSGGLESAARRRQMARSSVIFWHNHAHRGNRFIIRLMRLMSNVKTISTLLLQGKTTVVYAHLKGIVEGWRATSSPDHQ